MKKPELSFLTHIPYGPNYWGRIGASIAALFPGSTVNEALSTESCYVRIPGAKSELRISQHRLWSSNYYPSSLVPRTRRGLPDLADRALRAAISGAKRYQDIPDWEEL